MLNSHKDDWNNNQACNNPTEGENQRWDFEKLVPKEDAIYDYERVPVGWRGFDDQSGDLSSEEVVEVENGDRNRWSPR